MALSRAGSTLPYILSHIFIQRTSFTVKNNQNSSDTRVGWWTWSWECKLEVLVWAETFLQAGSSSSCLSWVFPHVWSTGLSVVVTGLSFFKTAWQDAGSSLWQWKIYQGMNTGLYATELDRFSYQVCEDIHDYPTDWINFFLLQSATNVHIINDYLHMFRESVNGHPSRTVICRYIVCSNIAWNYWDVIFRPYHPAL